MKEAKNEIISQNVNNTLAEMQNGGFGSIIGLASFKTLKDYENGNNALKLATGKVDLTRAKLFANVKENDLWKQCEIKLVEKPLLNAKGEQVFKDGVAVVNYVEQLEYDSFETWAEKQGIAKTQAHNYVKASMLIDSEGNCSILPRNEMFDDFSVSQLVEIVQGIHKNSEQLKELREIAKLEKRQLTQKEEYDIQLAIDLCTEEFITPNMSVADINEFFAKRNGKKSKAEKLKEKIVKESESESESEIETKEPKTKVEPIIYDSKEHELTKGVCESLKTLRATYTACDDEITITIYRV